MGWVWVWVWVCGWESGPLVNNAPLTGTETRLKASPHQRSCRIARASFQTRPCRSTEPLFHEFLRTTRGSRQHTVESFDTSCAVLAFLLLSLQYPPCSIVNEHSVRHALARVEQQTHGVHLRSLVLTSRHHHTPLHGILQLEEMVLPIAVPSHHQRNAHHCRVQRKTSSSQYQAAPLPNGKLDTTSEGFPQYNKLGSVRHVCELQGVMTS